jgi:superfamily II RNA helicase
LNDMMLGVPGRLSSQFRLTYNMILNLLRVEALKVEEMIKRSFSENAAQKLAPEQQRQVAVVSHRLHAISVIRKLTIRPKNNLPNYLKSIVKSVMSILGLSTIYQQR